MKKTKSGVELNEEIKVSFFENVTARNNVSVFLSEVLSMIQNGHCQGTIENVRDAKKQGFLKLLDERKKKLPAFTPSGIFKNGHSKKDLLKYSPVIVLDIDKVGEEKAEDVKQQAAKINKTYSAFISPSGEGLKILVKSNSTVYSHEQAFNQVAGYYEKKLGVEIDKSGKDYSRLCFLSYDPDLYFNEDAKIFEIETELVLPEYSSVSTTLTDELFENVVTFTENVQLYYPDNRNNHIYLLANNLNRIGIKRNEAEAKISLKYPDLDNNEIKSSAKSAYSHTAEHGMFTPDYINSVSSVRLARVANNNVGSGTPFIPAEVYKNLPTFLKKGTEAFEIPREKDVFLTGAFTILSGCFNTVIGIYDKREYHANLNSFIIAPPASGKGVLNSSRDLAQYIHDSIEKAYKDEMAREDGDPSKLPRSHFIPADSSSASFKANLKMNKEMGTVCETEADTLSYTLQNQWGSYSDLIRKAFQHEPVTYTRKSKGEDILSGEIKRPKLSICLTGTPSQVPKLLQSTEDGLFSRIIFYTYRNDNVPFFKDVFADFGIRNLTEYFGILAQELYKSYIKVKEINPVVFKLQGKHEKLFVTYFDKTVKKIYFESGEETRSIVNRLGLITFRLAMILTILRALDKNKLADDIICDDVDFNTSILLSNIYLEHALEVYKSLPGSIKINSNAESFWTLLPHEFKHAEAVKIGKTIADISEKTVSNYLAELKGTGLLNQPKNYGMYFK